MKKLSVFAVASMIAVGAFAASNEVTSVNAVGFIRTVIADGGWGLVSIPFNQIDGQNPTADTIFPDAPVSTRVWYYRDDLWKAEEKGFFGWAPGDTEFIRDDGLFVNAPTGGGAVEYTVMGEVPAEAETDTVMAAGWTLAGYAYPSDILLSASTLGEQAQSGDRLWWWDPTVPGWIAAEKGFFGWDVDPLLKAGQGYFFNNKASTFDWTEAKPYVWP